MIQITRDDPINLIRFDKIELQQYLIREILDLSYGSEINCWHYELYEYYQANLREYAILVALADIQWRKEIMEPLDNYTSLYLQEVRDIIKELPPLTEEIFIFDGGNEEYLNLYYHYGTGDGLLIYPGIQLAFIYNMNSYFNLK